MIMIYDYDVRVDSKIPFMKETNYVQITGLCALDPFMRKGDLQKHKSANFLHTTKAQKRYYVSAKAIVIENRNNCLRNPRTVITDFEKVAINAVSNYFRKCMSSTIATVVFVRFSANLKHTSHISQRRPSSMTKNTKSSKHACALIYFRSSSLLDLRP